MPYCITCSTKILTWAIALFLFILVGVVCEFAMVPGVYILLSPQEKEVHSATRSSKRFKPLSAIILSYQGYC